MAPATAAPLGSKTVPEMPPPVAAYRDRDKKKSGVRRAAPLPSIEGTNLESSLRTICGAVGIDRWAFPHASSAASCTGGEAFTSAKGRGGTIPSKIVLLEVRDFALNGCYFLRSTARIIHLYNSCYRCDGSFNSALKRRSILLTEASMAIAATSDSSRPLPMQSSCLCDRMYKRSGSGISLSLLAG